jgi:glycosyltransferase involved in cell wall biosynthesis
MSPLPVVFGYSPYLNVLGGGERYFAYALEELACEYKVKLLLPSDQWSALGKLQERFGLDITRIEPVRLQHGHSDVASLHREIQSATLVDSIFFQMCNNVPIDSLSSIKILHLQLVWPTLGSSRNIFKESLTWIKAYTKIYQRLLRQDAIFYPSKYIYDGNNSLFPLTMKAQMIITPPVSGVFQPLDSARNVTIINVGRFIPQKRQKELIFAFRKLLREYNPHRALRMIIVGSTKSSYLDDLIDLAHDLPIEFMAELSERELASLYSKTLIFWSGTGLNHNPVDSLISKKIHLEPFGLAIAEAMACGCVPIAAAGGGVTEVFEDNVSGFAVQSLEDLVDRTAKLLQDSSLLETMSKAAVQRSVDHSKAEFGRRLRALFARAKARRMKGS